MSDDTISRQAAIDALDGEIEVTGKANAKAVLKYTQMVSDRIKALPSAQSERKRGKWIDAKPRSGQLGKVCSACGNEAYWDSDYGQQLFDYCPYCGSNNGEESDNG